MFHRSPALRVKKLWLDHRWIEGLLIFCAATLICTAWIGGPVFSDPDSFYHIKVTQLMLHRHEAITDFPWLAFTTLKDAYVDHHLLYHILLMPFVWALGGVIGIKVATALLFGACITLFYGILRSLHVRYAAVFALMLLCTEGFAFRLALAKAPSIGFLFLLGGYALIVHRQHRLLVLLNFFFVWAYGGFLLLPILATIYATISALYQLTHTGRWPRLRELLHTYLPTWATVGGTVAGLLLHPSFPKHFQFYWQQIIQIGLVNYRDIIGVGGEWYPTPFSELLVSPILLTITLGAAATASIAMRKKQSVAAWTALAMTIVFFLFTLKSQRYIEYYIPWGYLTAALFLHGSGILHRGKYIISILRGRMHADVLPRTAAVLAVLYIVIFLPGIMITNMTRAHHSLHNGVPTDRFAGAMNWLRSHSTKGDVLLHNDWDDFPVLFYGVTRLRYIVGLDPTFMYKYNPDLYWKWVNITIGEQKDNLLEIIQGDFGARFVLVDSDHVELYNNIINDGRFSLVYHDSETSIFRVPRSKTDSKVQTSPSDPDQTLDPESTP
jgi:hypothetical protein